MIPYVAISDRLVLFPHKNLSYTEVWDIEDNQSVGVLEGLASMVIGSAGINNHGTMAVTLTAHDDVNEDEDLYVKIWNLGTMQCVANLRSYLDAFSLLGSDRLLLGAQDGPIKVWDIGGSAPVALMDLEGHSGYVFSISSSEILKIALSGSTDRNVRLWDLRTGQCVRVMEGHTNDVNSVSMDSACQTAVSGSFDNSVKLWDLGSGRCINTYLHGQVVRNVMMHESGGSFIAVGSRLSIKAWTTAPGSERPILKADFESYCDDDFEVPGAASRDLSKVAICYMRADGAGLGVKVWK